MDSTKQFFYIVLVGLIGLTGAVVVILLRPDATATFGSILTFVLVTIIAAVPTYRAISKQGEAIKTVVEKAEKIETQTNGNLHRRDEEIRRLTDLLLEQGIDPEKKEVTK